MPDSGVTDVLELALQEQEEGLRNCVHCGFCLPACPTYRRLGDEADSPRGRLYLMQAVVEGRLEADSDAFQVHIDRCLGCRACEPVCPSGVAYGHLLERARQVAREARKLPVSSRVLLRVFGTEWIMRPAMFTARLFRATRFPALLTRLLSGSPFGRVSLALAMLAASAPVRQRRYRPRADLRRPALRQGDVGSGGDPVRVGLLTGCVQAGLFSRVNRATKRVLEANGYHLVSVQGQGCCGALHAHGGDLEAARSMARRNVEAFGDAGLDYLVTNASGCGAAAASYGSLLAHDADFARRAAAIAERVRDVSELLADRGPLPGGPLSLSVTCDAPCHLLHARGVDGSQTAVLEAIPKLEVRPLPNAGECCGGAGIYGLTHPRLGGWIGSDKVRSVLETGAEVLVTGNPGCMMQIGAGLRLAGRNLPVFHPVELLDESYRRGGIYRTTGDATSLRLQRVEE